MESVDIAKSLMASFHGFKRIFRPHNNPFPGLKPGEVSLLFHISEGSKTDAEGINISKLSSRMQVTSPSITQIVTSMEDRGLVARRMDSEDRRSVKVTLTEKGIEMTRGAENQMLAMLTGLVEHLGQERSLELVGLLDDMIGYLGNR